MDGLFHVPGNAEVLEPEIAVSLMAAPEANHGSLSREIGLWLLCFYGLGNILGAGIYVLIGKIAGHAGYFTVISFFIAGLVASFTALTYAELSSRFPVAAGAAVYLYEGYGKKWLSLGAGWVIAASGMLSAATIVRGFAGYTQYFIPIADEILITLALSILIFVALIGVTESVVMAVVFTVIELIGLILIIVLGCLQIDRLPEVIESMPSIMNLAVWSGIILGAFLAFYAFIGFEDIVNLAEEIKNPERNLPLAIITALGITTLIYALVACSAILIVPPERLSQSDAPLAEIYQVATGKEPVLITLISLAAVINGALIQIIMASRILYGMSKRGWLSAMFGYVHPKMHTPLMSTLFVGLTIFLLALSFPLETLASYSSFLILIIFLLVNIALLRIKNQPAPNTALTFPNWIPKTGASGSLLLLIGLVFLR